MDVKGDLVVKNQLRVNDDAVFDKGLDASYMEIIDSKLPGTAGGGFTQGDWRTRDLTTTIKTGFATSITLAVSAGDGGQFVIPAGEYYIEASAPASNVNEHTARIADVTDLAGEFGATVVTGTAEFAADITKWRDSTGSGAGSAMTVAASGQTRSIMTGRFTVTRSTTLELQHRCSVTQAADGFGGDNNFYVTNNIYSIVKMWQVRQDD